MSGRLSLRSHDFAWKARGP